MLAGRARSRLAESCAAQYQRLGATLSGSVLAAAEAQIAPFHMDRIWADHLARMADVREGITLVRIGGQDRLSES